MVQAESIQTNTIVCVHQLNERVELLVSKRLREPDRPKCYQIVFDEVHSSCIHVYEHADIIFLLGLLGSDMLAVVVDVNSVILTAIVPYIPDLLSDVSLFPFALDDQADPNQATIGTDYFD